VGRALNLRSTELTPRALRFANFELDLETAELRRGGLRVKLQAQPFRVLALLASHPREMLTRDEIHAAIWDDEASEVDVEQALNFCIRQIRVALGDQAGTPRFIETLPRRGYRFIAPVEVLNGDPGSRPAPGSGVAASPAGTVGATEGEPPVALRRWRLAAGLAGLGLGFALATAAFLLWHDEPPVPEYRRVTFGRGFVGAARFGPTGEVIYSGAWEGRPMATRAVSPENLMPRPLPSLAPDLVAIARDGEAAFVTAEGHLQRVPLAGGPAKSVLDGVVAADWLADGSDFAVARRRGDDVQLEYPIGRVLYTTRGASHLRLSPDGTRLAFLEHPLRGDDRGSVVVLDRSGQRRVLSEAWGSAEGLAWRPDGAELWFTAARVGAENALWAVDLAGNVRLVAPALGRLTVHDIDASGRVLLERRTVRLEMRFAREGAVERDLSWLDQSRVVDLSPDGRRLLFLESGEGGGPEYAIYLRSTDGEVPVRIGSGRAQGLSPDAAWVLAIPVGTPDHLDLIPTGAGEARVLRDPALVEYEWAGFLADGRGVLLTGRAPGASPRVYRMALAGGPARPVTPEGVGVWRNTIAPDGSGFVAHCADEGTVACLYPLDGAGAARRLDATRGFVALGWAGPRLLLREPSELPVRVHVLEPGAAAPRFVRELDVPDRSGVSRIHAVATTPDLDAWAWSFARQLSDLYVVEGLR